MPTIVHNRDPGSRCFRPEAPFYFARALAEQANCDLAVPNGQGSGIGDVLVFTPLVEEYARRAGRRIRLLTATLDPVVGVVAGESEYPIWSNNPFILEIVDASQFGNEAVRALNEEKNNCCQFNHIIENICVSYGLSVRRVRPSLYLTMEEQAWSLDTLKDIRRPLIAVHPGGKTSSLPNSPWYEENWSEVIRRCRDVADFVQIGKYDYDQRTLRIAAPKTTLRQMFSIVWACDAFIGFDSGPMHVAAAFDRPSIIIWDAERKLVAEESWQRGFSPAVTLRWGYPQNRNLMILGERTDEVIVQIERWIRELCMRLAWTPHSSASTNVRP
jgi:glycosyl transferase family 9 (putative heptosyltransferase)